MNSKDKRSRILGLIGMTVAAVGILIVALILVLAVKSYLADLDTANRENTPLMDKST